MIIIVIGSERAELIPIKKRDYNKHMMVTRGQLYMMMPDELKRCLRYDWGRRISDEEVIVYPENGIIPYLPRRQYTMGKLLSEIDNLKNSIGKRAGLFGDPIAAIGSVRSIWRELAGIMPFIVAGIVLLWAVVFH